MGYWASSQYDVSDAFYMQDEYYKDSDGAAICLYALWQKLICVRPMIAF